MSRAHSHKPRATFYFDLGSPYAYLTAERLRSGGAPAEQIEWQPVLLGALFKLTGRSSWALGDPRRRQRGMAEIERRARIYSLPPVHWPDPWPGNYLMAMRAATFAHMVGRGLQFTACAFASAFQRGNDLGVPAHVLDSADAAGLDAQAVREATEDPQIKLALRLATDAAHDRGVFGVPTIAIDGELLWGDDRLAEALERLERAR